LHHLIQGIVYRNYRLLAESILITKLESDLSRLPFERGITRLNREQKRTRNSTAVGLSILLSFEFIFQFNALEMCVNSSLATCYIKAGYRERCFTQLHRRIRKRATRFRIK